MPIDVEDKGGGIFIYKAIVPMEQLKESHKMKEKDELSLSLANLVPWISEGLKFSSSIVLDIMGHAILADQNQPARHLHAQKQRAHAKYFVGPRLGKSHLLIEDLQFEHLAEKNKRGDPIAVSLASGASIFAFNNAHIWIISTQSPDAVEREGVVKKEHARAFYSREDAEKFLDALKNHMPLLKKAHDILHIRFGEEKAKENFNAVKEALEQLHQKILASPKLLKILQENQKELKDESFLSTLQKVLQLLHPNFEGISPAHKVQIEHLLPKLEKQFKALIINDPTENYLLTPLIVEAMTRAAASKHIHFFHQEPKHKP